MTVTFKKFDPTSSQSVVVAQNPNSGAAQRSRLKFALKIGPVNTFCAREDLGITHPAARIRELRSQDMEIVTKWTFKKDACGFTHRIANYVLIGGN